MAFLFLLWLLALLHLWLTMPRNKPQRHILIKKDLAMPPTVSQRISPNTLIELKDLVSHIEKVAVNIKAKHYLPHDGEFDQLAINLFRLGTELKTFVQRKADIA